ncbi:hypothetical protein [Streptomyces sp. NPDC052015]|uniref:hypothetical protein n=1 Tax=Streptomyces sp. NPDC052015 TaxID=3154755 RepID=UPI0034299E0E
MTVGAGGQQTTGVVDRLVPVRGEDGVLCERDRSDQGRVAYVRVVVAEERIDREKIARRRSRIARISLYSSRNPSPQWRSPIVTHSSSGSWAV